MWRSWSVIYFGEARVETFKQLPHLWQVILVLLFICSVFATAAPLAYLLGRRWFKSYVGWMCLAYMLSLAAILDVTSFRNYEALYGKTTENGLVTYIELACMCMLTASTGGLFILILYLQRNYRRAHSNDQDHGDV